MNYRYERALVLSGGNVKGAFQAGAIAVALEKGFVPDAIYGISVGALNGAFLADRAGCAAMQGKKPDWPAIGQELVDFWTREITSPKSIVKRKSILRLATSLIFKRWKGFTDTRPLRQLVEREVSLDHLKHSPVYFSCGATNLHTGQIFYADIQNGSRNIHDYILASTAIPFFMPQVVIQSSVSGESREHAYVDGIGRDSSPLGYAIQKGATHVMGIYCQPENLDLKSDLDHGSVAVYIERILDILSNEQIVNDHRQGVLINELLRKGVSASPGMPLVGKRVVRGLKRVIRPEKEIPFEQRDVNPKVIATMIDWGKRQAEGYFRDIVTDPNENPLLGDPMTD